jgi:hypothetical protein
MGGNWNDMLSRVQPEGSFRTVNSQHWEGSVALGSLVLPPLQGMQLAALLPPAATFDQVPGLQTQKRSSCTETSTTNAGSEAWELIMRTWRSSGHCSIWWY